MKHVLVILPLSDDQKARLEAINPDCSYEYVSDVEVTGEQIRSANIILGNPAPGQIQASENL